MTELKKDYKQTINLPKTDFPMKADLPKREPDFLKTWDENKIYQQLMEKNKGAAPFILHDGPPYANGHIHFGHILNKVLKDIIVKYKNMAGFYSPYIPGWDCHGLPIELGAVKELTEKEKDPTKVANPLVRRQACRDYAHTFIDAQKAEFKRLGIFGDWQNPYLTLTNQYEADIAREFTKLYLNGYIYEGKKPVYWCPSCQTALAEAEVEYENVTSPSIYVKFKVQNAEVFDLESIAPTKPISFVIWTTTPWTLPANVALAVGEFYDYVALDVGDEVLIVANNLSEPFLQAIKKEGVPLKKWLGDTFAKEKIIVEHPFIKRTSPVVIGHHVTLESGTGVVHIAPGHGQEDFQVGQANNLPTLCPVDSAGKLMDLGNAKFEEVKTWQGLFIKKANKVIVDFLADKKILLNSVNDNLEHSYPHCWRCKNPVIFRATEQWFASLTHNDLRKKVLKTIDCDVHWIPSWGHDRIYGMIENRPDWCLSRQRIWGVPIIVHHCTKCRKQLLTQEISDYICARFDKEGADAWWGTTGALLPDGTKCECGSTDFEKEKSILDVWFDSGVSHAAVLERRTELGSPADLYLEGSDQHRGWFHSSILTSMATRNRPPYRNVLTHGFVVDGQGKKYSKSAKNYIPPDKVLSEMGAEILRLWVAAEDYRNDIRVSDEIIKVLSEIYRKIRNTSRFMLGNFYDFSMENYIPLEKRTELDRYALHLTAQVIQKSLKAYEDYEFHVVHHSLNKFFTVDLSAFYLDILKDRLYCDKADGFLRRSAQSTLFDIMTSIIPLMAPILSFTAEEVWQAMPVYSQKEKSVFLATWPKKHTEWVSTDIEARWERIRLIRDEGLKVLEGARQKKEIGHGLDAKLILSGDAELLNFLNQYRMEWAQIFIVSQAELVSTLKEVTLESKLVPTLRIAVTKAEGLKCERCWNYSVDVGKNTTHPTLCDRCVQALS